MRTHYFFRKIGSILLAVSLLGAQVAPVQAGMVSTAEAVAAEQNRIDRDKLTSMLEREDLQRELAALGVDVQDAQARVAAMTDAEVAHVNDRIAELPAGGSVAGVLLFILVVLIITDVMGLTDVFSFVRPQ